MSYQTTLRQLVAEAKAAGIDLPQLAPLLLEEWNNTGPSIYGPDGMSKPDANGFVRFKQLDDQRAAYLKDGQTEAANELRYSYDCYPGASACEPGTLAQYSSANNLSNANFFYGMGTGNWFLLHPAKEYKDAFGQPYFRLDYSATISDAFPLPYLEKGTGKAINRTVEECVAYQLAHAAAYVKK